LMPSRDRSHPSCLCTGVCWVQVRGPGCWLPRHGGCQRMQERVVQTHITWLLFFVPFKLCTQYMRGTLSQTRRYKMHLRLGAPIPEMKAGGQAVSMRLHVLFLCLHNCLVRMFSWKKVCNGSLFATDRQCVPTTAPAACVGCRPEACLSFLFSGSHSALNVCENKNVSYHINY